MAGLIRCPHSAGRHEMKAAKAALNFTFHRTASIAPEHAIAGHPARQAGRQRQRHQRPPPQGVQPTTPTEITTKARARLEVATSKASMAVAQDSRIGAINELDTTAEQLLTDLERTPISTVTPA